MNPIVDYDPEKRILHITAEQKIIVSDEKTLNEMCNFVCSFLTENGKGERSYMIVDISKIVIDPDLAPEYSEHIKKLLDKLLYPEGLVRYGLEITRLTARLGHARNRDKEPLFFHTKDEAFAFVQGRIHQQSVAVNS